jgi:signal peptidase I
MSINEKTKNIIEWGYCILIAIVLALLVRYYIGTPTIVKQPSMYDTLIEGQRLILNRWTRTVNRRI